VPTGVTGQIKIQPVLPDWPFAIKVNVTVVDLSRPKSAPSR
jgi:hypothetical protein